MQRYESIVKHLYKGYKLYHIINQNEDKIIQITSFCILSIAEHKRMHRYRCILIHFPMASS